MSYIEAFFGHETRIRILRLLAEQDEPLTGRGVWRGVAEGGEGPRSKGVVHEKLRELEDTGILQVSRVIGSPAKIYRLDREHPFVRRVLLPAITLERATAGATPAEALRLWVEPDAADMGVYSATLADPGATGGELVLHYLVQHDASDPERTERWLLGCIKLVAERTGQGAKTVRETFQSARDKAEDPGFRASVLDGGVHICGARLASLAKPGGY